MKPMLKTQIGSCELTSLKEVEYIQNLSLYWSRISYIKALISCTEQAGTDKVSLVGMQVIAGDTSKLITVVPIIRTIHPQNQHLFHTLLPDCETTLGFKMEFIGQFEAAMGLEYRTQVQNFGINVLGGQSYILKPYGDDFRASDNVSLLSCRHNNVAEGLNISPTDLATGLVDFWPVLNLHQ